MEYDNVPVSLIQNYENALKAITEDYYKTEQSKELVEYVLQKMAQHGFNLALSFGGIRDLERERIGKRIKDLRLGMSLDAKTFASKAGITPANLCRIEQGSYSPGLNVLLKIAEALNSKLDFIPQD